MRILGPVACALVTTAALAGCALPLDMDSDGAATAPPRIVITAHGTKQWDKPGAFGPIPAQQIEAGKLYCATLNHSGKTFSARGYHPRATTADGYIFQDGGFLCRQD